MPDDRRTLKYDPHSNQISFVVHGLERQRLKWNNGALATDGVIYCIPSFANHVLAIDPLGEFSVATKTNMEEHPEELGFLFRRINDSSRTDKASNRTYLDCAVTKFGMQKVLEIVQEHMPPANEVCGVYGVYPFVVAASYKESPLSVVYFLLRRDPFVIDCKISKMKPLGTVYHQESTVRLEIPISKSALLLFKDDMIRSFKTIFYM